MNLDFFLDFLFPAVCVNCNTYTNNRNFVCENCFSKIEIFSGLFCGKCRARLPEGRKVCHKDTPYILGAATSYGNEVVRELIHGLKFKSLRSLQEPLSKLLVAYAKDEGLKADYIVPVPLGRKRERERGYNQAELLAKKLSEYTGIPMLRALQRIKETKPQSEIKDHKERVLNIQDSFEARGELKGKTIILLDDVTTSGSTFLFASKALKKSGVKKIYALALAKA